MTSNSERFADSPVVDGGTPLADWAGWDADIGTVGLDGCPGLVLVAPHPDDETLGMGATAATLRAAGLPVHVVSVSDGGAAFPGIADDARAALEARRRDELDCALDALGVDEVVRLGLPDGAVAHFETRLADLLAEVLRGYPAGIWCAATWRGDGHPDHEAVGRAASVAARVAGAVFVEYPVWMWHWASPGHASVPWQRARRVPVSDDALAAKRRAVSCYASQTVPADDGYTVLPPAVVDRLLGVGEVLFV